MGATNEDVSFRGASSLRISLIPYTQSGVFVHPRRRGSRVAVGLGEQCP